MVLFRTLYFQSLASKIRSTAYCIFVFSFILGFGGSLSYGQEVKEEQIPAMMESLNEPPDLLDALRKIAVPLEISLPDVISYTLLNQWDIKISISEVSRKQGIVQKAAGAFDTTLDGRERHVWQRDVQVSGLLKSTHWGFMNQLAATISRTTRFGTKTKIGAEVDQTYNPLYLIINGPPFVPYNRIENFSLFFTIEQPLLRGFFYNPDYANELSARYDVEAAKYNLIQVIAKQIHDVVQAYWNLSTAKEIYQIEQTKKTSLYDLAITSKKLIEGGEMAATELDQQFAEIYREEKNLILAEQVVYDNLNHLLFLMGDGPQSLCLNIPQLTLEAYPCIIANKPPLCVNHITKIAVMNRPDLRALEWQIGGAGILLKSAQFGLLPELNVQVGGTFLNYALNKKARPFFGAANSDLPEKDLSLQVNLSVPFSNDEALGAYRQSYEQNRQLIYQSEKLIEDIRLSVATAIRNHFALIEQIENAKKAVKWYEITLEDEKRKLIQGLSTIFIVVDFENRLSNERIDLVQTQNALAQNLVDILFLTGTLIDYNCRENKVYVSDVTRIEHLLRYD